MWWSLLLLCVSSCLAYYSPDEILSLPGLNTRLNFQQWSGYLQASPGQHLHYWFVTSQRSPDTDPVVLWLNGGPGCSSLDGFLAENGPLHVNDDGSTLYINEYSWNKVANVLYLESPAGVGFSYSDDQNYATNDNEVAENNYLALQDFFNKFPSFKSNDFYIFGESYGGVYAPTLSLKVADGPAPINFKGYGVGNGLSSTFYNDQSLVYFGYYHGLFGDTLWSNLNTYCCEGGSCNFVSNNNYYCQVFVEQVFQIIYNSGLNLYSLYLNCAGGIPGSHSRFHTDLKNLFQHYHFEIPKQNAATLKNIAPPCINDTAQWTWLNRADVRQALHIPSFVQPWELCSSVVGENYQRIYNTMHTFYLQLLGKGLRVLVYNGDTDMACNFLGENWFVKSLNQQQTLTYQPWIYNDQIAGFYEQYGNLTFLTVKGVGHMVPQWAPARALKMFESYLTNSQY
ncbi:lysosomal protective protein-like isoform X1 [Stegostoma tigrinum]|uniref:lysosomal protective protein-like isoform X1 n=1 Tax=Stegostoma tigrinum TaxID=3053191 RepID=UPI002870687C|nr:lysosomal protective protein-like isoform X1 [Stegostoma tigrinum]